MMEYYEDTFTDYDNKKVIVCWTERLWNKHLRKHQLKDFRHTSFLISEALLKPSLVLRGMKPDQKRELIQCYYQEHKRHQSDVYFTKIVTGCDRSPFYVKTAFVQWMFCDLVVQEKRYPEDFKEIWREQKTFL